MGVTILIPPPTVGQAPTGTDHNALTNLTVGDPHAQYARGAAANTFTASQIIEGDLTVTGTLTAAVLGDATHNDDATDVHGIPNTALLETAAGAAAKVADHAAHPDPHTAYLTAAAADAVYEPLGAAASVQSVAATDATTKVSTHAAAADPHAGYQKESDLAVTVKAYRLDEFAAPTAAVALGSQKITGLATPTVGTDASTKAYADANVTTHEAAADPHLGYQKESEKDAASGYAGLNASTRVPAARLGSGTPDSTTFLRGDQVWVVPTLVTPFDWKESVRAATAAALPANTRSGNVLTASANGALPALDGVALVVTNRLLVKDEATGANNGFYTLTDAGSAGTPWTLTRSTDADVSAEMTAGAAAWVSEGTLNGNKAWALITDDPITLNTTALSFTQIGGTGSTVPADAVSGAGVFGAAGTVGVGTDYAREDHAHPMPADPVTAHAAAGDPHVGYVLNAELANHEADTTSIHGIADTSVLATASSVAAALSTHAGLADPHAGYVLESLVTTKGDLIAATGSAALLRLGAGANYSRLVADSAQSTGLKYLADAVYDIRNYGAVADGPTGWEANNTVTTVGCTDNTAAIQAACDAAAAAGGGTVLIPAGMWVTGQLILKNRVWLVGVGSLASVLVLKNSTNVSMIKNYVSTDLAVTDPNGQFCGLKDLMLHGNYSNQTGSSSHGVEFSLSPLFGASKGAADLDYDTHHRLTEVNIWSFRGDGFRATGRAEHRLVNVHSYYNWGYGFSPSVDTYLVGCVAGQNQLAGFNLDASGIHLSTCKSFYSGWSTQATGYGFYIRAGLAGGIELSSCSAQDNAASGYFLDNAYHVTLAACEADSNSIRGAGLSPGFEIFESNACMLKGCISMDRSFNGSGAGTQTHAVKLYGSSPACIGNTIEVSHAFSPGKTGVGAALDPTSVGVESNTLRLSTVTGAWDSLISSSHAQGTSITPDAEGANVRRYNLTVGAGVVTVNAPTNPYIGARLTLIFVNPASGVPSLSLNAIYAKSWVPTLTANHRNILDLMYDGAKWVQIGASVGVV